jgi:HAMP domain-containing protein
MTDFVDINLLPRPVRPRTIQVDTRWRLPMIVGLGLMTIALLLLMAAFLQKIRNDRLLVRQEDELQDLGTPVAAYAITQAEVEALQEQLSTLARQVDQLEGDAERVERENPSLAPFLRALTGTSSCRARQAQALWSQTT